MHRCSAAQAFARHSPLPAHAPSTMRTFIIAATIAIAAAVKKGPATGLDNVFFAAGSDAPQCSVVDGRTVVKFTDNIHPSFKCTHTGSTCECSNPHPTHHSGACREFDDTTGQTQPVGGDCTTSGVDEDPNCQDSSIYGPHCAGDKRRGRCENTGGGPDAFMWSHCKKTCNVCGPNAITTTTTTTSLAPGEDPNCQDSSIYGPHCAGDKRRGRCENTGGGPDAFMKAYCKKTCGNVC
jgi:hypothetical protein